MKKMVIALFAVVMVVCLSANAFAAASLKHTLAGIFDAVDNGRFSVEQGRNMFDTFAMDLIKKAEFVANLDEAVNLNRTLLFIQDYVSPHVIQTIPEITKVMMAGAEREFNLYDFCANPQALRRLGKRIKENPDWFDPAFSQKYLSLIEERVSQYTDLWNKH